MGATSRMMLLKLGSGAGGRAPAGPPALASKLALPRGLGPAVVVLLVPLLLLLLLLLVGLQQLFGGLNLLAVLAGDMQVQAPGMLGQLLLACGQSWCARGLCARLPARCGLATSLSRSP